MSDCSYPDANRRADELETLFNIQQAITRQLDIEAVLQLIADEARRLTGSLRTVVFLLEGDTARIAVVSGEPHSKSVLGYRMPVAGSLISEAIQSQTPIFVADAQHDPHVQADPRRQALLQRVGVRSLIVVPLVSNARSLGAISISDKQDGPFGPDDERVLRMLASSAVIGLENARLYQAEQERRQVAEGLADILAALNSTRSLAEILEYIVTQAVRLLHTSSGAIYHLNPDEGLLKLETAGEAGLPQSIPVGQGPIGRTVTECRPAVVPDMGGDNATFDGVRQAPPGNPYGALLAVPLTIKEEVYGCLALYFTDPKHFSEEEVDLATVFGAQAALAIDNARLRQQVEQAAVVRERGRLARELHDSVTQSLYSLTLLTEGWRRIVESGNVEHVADYLAEAGEITRQGLKEMRLLIHELRPLLLEQEGLAGALQQRLEAVEGRAGIEARLLVEGTDELPGPIEEAFYRIAQEALNNALKHAQATSVIVRLQADDQEAELTVTDNGRGFDLEAGHDKGGLGLSSMRERAENLNGSLELVSAPGQGTTVTVRIRSLLPEKGGLKND